MSKAPNAAARGTVELLGRYTDPALSVQRISLPISQASEYTELTDDITLQSGDLWRIKLRIRHKSLRGKVFVDPVSLPATNAAIASVRIC